MLPQMISNSRLTAGAAQTNRPLTRAEVEMCGRLNLLSQYNRSPSPPVSTPLSTPLSLPKLRQGQAQQVHQRSSACKPTNQQQLLLQCHNNNNNNNNITTPVNNNMTASTFDPVVGSGRRNGSRTESGSSSSNSSSPAPQELQPHNVLSTGIDFDVADACFNSNNTATTTTIGNSILTNNNEVHCNEDSISTSSNNNSSDHLVVDETGQEFDPTQTGNQLVAQIMDILKRNKSGGGCGFCRRNREPPAVYMNHQLRDTQNQVTCPQLRKHVCELCGATGAKAHTRSYCNVSQRILDAGLPEHHATTRLLRNMSMVSNSRYNAAGKLRHR